MQAYILCINKEKSVAYANDCQQSCKENDLPFTLVWGIKDENAETLSNNFNVRWRSYNPDYDGEHCCTASHFRIWRQIVEVNEPAIVLEHDAIIKSKHINDIKVNDDEILFLGPRIFSRNDYEFPEGEELKYVPVKKFLGTHAYAITPNTAKKLLAGVKEDPMVFPVDGILGIVNPYKIKLVALDPPVAVGEIGNRGSFTTSRDINTNPTENFINVGYNHQHLDGFLMGLKLSGKTGYDFSVDWFSEHIPHWEKSLELAGMKKDQHLNILEIGCYEGKSTTWISDNLLDHEHSVLVCCDTFKGSIENQSNPNLAGLKDRFMWNISQSKNYRKVAINECKSDYLFGMFKLIGPDLKFDIIYIDGSHETDQAFHDALNGFAFLKKGGIIIFDDYLWTMPGTGKATVRDALHKFEEFALPKPILSGWQRTYTKQ